MGIIEQELGLKPVRKKVVFIETVEGEQGGERWRLTLECGHIESRPKINPNPANFRHLMMPPERFCAPKSVKCLTCSIREKSNRT